MPHGWSALRGRLHQCLAISRQSWRKSRSYESGALSTSTPRFFILLSCGSGMSATTSTSFGLLSVAGLLWKHGREKDGLDHERILRGLFKRLLELFKSRGNKHMLRGGLLCLPGIPIPIIIILWVLGYLH